MQDVVRVHAVRDFSGLPEAYVGGWDMTPRRLVEALSVYSLAFDWSLAEEKAQRAEEQNRELERRLHSAQQGGQPSGAGGR